MIAFVAAACSPKLRPVTTAPVKSIPRQATVNQPAKVVAKPAEPRVSSIALLLPFGLEHLAPGGSYNAVSLREADIALGYYKGFKLALDSLTNLGFNFKLMVYDSRDQKAQVHSLATNPTIKSSDLIVGPVFPSDIKAFTAAYPKGRQPIVSPLSPASPASVKNTNLVTMMPPLEFHAWAAAKYINDKMRPAKVFILKSGFSEENEYLIPFKKAIDSLSHKQIKVITLTVIHGQLNTLLPQLSSDDKNVFIVPATDQHFLTLTLRALDTLNTSYPVAVFGHPNWINFSFLKTDLLQRLNTFVTSAEKVDYKAENTVSFVRQYRNIYHADPTPYAIKGFDEGMYLGNLLANERLKEITKTDYAGLHNNFKFERKNGLGWVNTHVNVYKYANFELKKVE